MSEAPHIMAVAFGVDPITIRLIKSALTRVQFRELPLEISAMLKPQLDFEPDLIFCGGFNDNISMVEVAQGIRSMYANPPIYFATSERKGFDRKGLTKHGFTDAFLMPMDQGIIRDLIAEGSADFKNVPLVDLSPETVLDFDTYLLLPMNRKYIKFSSAGYALDAARVKRLLAYHVSSVHVARSEIKKFYSFTAEQLKKLTHESAISETERRQRMHAAVRSLLTGFLTDSAELQDCSQIVHSYILSGGGEDKSSLYEKILRLGGNGGDGYTHVSNVSTLAALLAMAVTPSNVENVALAGLLHDIGMAEIPVDVQLKGRLEWSADERTQYENHPHHSVQLLKARNIQVSTVVFKFIEQHHERFDGRGYPNRVSGINVAVESQLISIADEFDYHTTVELGQERKPAQAVIQDLLKSSAYDPQLLRELAKLF